MAQKAQPGRSTGATQNGPNGPREKILRIGVILGGKIVEERLIRTRETVTIGQSAKNTFSIPAVELPRSWSLFKLVGNRYELHVTDSMDGRLSDGGNVQALAQLKAGGQAQKDAQGWRLPLTENARGKIILGDLTLLFQFVLAPPLQPRPQLPHSVRGSLADRIDPYLAIVLVLSFLVHGGLGMYVYRMDVPRKPEPDEIPGKYPQGWLKPPPETKETAPTKGDEKKEEVAKEPEKDEPKKGGEDKPKVEKASKEPDPGASERAAARESAKTKGMIAVMGSKSKSGKQSKFADVTGGKQGSGLGIEKARKEGIELASGGDPGKGTKDTGGPNVGKGDGRNPTGPTGTDPGGPKVKEEKIEGVAKVDKAEEDMNEGLDADGVIAKVRGSYYKRIQKCYNDALKANTGLKGRVEITISIGASGKVTDADVQGFDSGMDACIKAEAKKWVFDNPEKKKAAFSFAFSLKSNK